MENYDKNDSIKISLSDIINAVVLLFGLTAFCMIFVDCVKCTNFLRATTCFKGYQTAFGGAAGILSFSFFNFLPFLFVLVASVFAGLKFFGIKISDFDFDWIVAGLFFLAAIFFFVSPVTLQFQSTTEAQNFKNIYSFYMGVGLIVAAVLSLFASLLVAGQKVFGILVKKGYFNVEK